MARRKSRKGRRAGAAGYVGRVDRPVELTEPLRRKAPLVFPLIVLMSLLFTGGLWWTVALPIAVLAVFAGLAFRRARRASVVLAGGAVFTWLFGVYALGIAPAIGYLTLSELDVWLPWAPLVDTVLLLGFLAFRVRATLAEHWAQPFDATPGVVVSREYASLWRDRSDMADGGGWMAVGILAVTIAIVAASFVEESPLHLFLVLVVGGQGLALILTCVVASWLAYFIALRRWERATGIRLRVPALSRKPSS
jgi:hypothetical protein